MAIENQKKGTKFNDQTEPFNGKLTARPHGSGTHVRDSEEPGPAEGILEETEMNLADAKASGYVGPDGKAISKAKKDVEGSPTGAYTDIGHGRSSAVRQRDGSQ